MIHIHIFTMLYICINKNTYRGYQKGGCIISNFVLYNYIYINIYNALYMFINTGSAQ